MSPCLLQNSHASRRPTRACVFPPTAKRRKGSESLNQMESCMRFMRFTRRMRRIGAWGVDSRAKGKSHFSYMGMPFSPFFLLPWGQRRPTPPYGEHNRARIIDGCKSGSCVESLFFTWWQYWHFIKHSENNRVLVDHTSPSIHCPMTVRYRPATSKYSCTSTQKLAMIHPASSLLQSRNLALHFEERVG
jgi:hypothetical protein